MKYIFAGILILFLLSCSNRKDKYIKLGKSGDAVLFLDTETKEIISVETRTGGIVLYRKSIDK